MKQSATLFKKGFTLIELIVVIAIIGVLAAVLITIIDPLDKINSANDSGVISTVSQIGRANDTYAANHNNYYAPGADLDAAMTALNTSGESKLSTYNVPSNYTVTYFVTPVGCTNVSPNNCIGYGILVAGLDAKKHVNGTPPSAGPSYQVVNGKGCYVTVANSITQARLDALGSASTGTGACP